MEVVVLHELHNALVARYHVLGTLIQNHTAQRPDWLRILPRDEPRTLAPDPPRVSPRTRLLVISRKRWPSVLLALPMNANPRRGNAGSTTPRSFGRRREDGSRQVSAPVPVTPCDVQDRRLPMLTILESRLTSPRQPVCTDGDSSPLMWAAATRTGSLVSSRCRPSGICSGAVPQRTASAAPPPPAVPVRSQLFAHPPRPPVQMADHRRPTRT